MNSSAVLELDSLVVGYSGTPVCGPITASADDFQKMMSNPAAGEHMQRAADIANHYDPNLYRISSIHHASHNGEPGRKWT